MKLTVKMSKRLKMLLENTTWVQRLAREFATGLEAEWSKEAGSGNWWIRGRHKPREPKPSPGILTQRSGRLVSAATGKSESFKSITVNESGFSIYRRITVPYANRQEKQNSGERSYMVRSFTEIMNDGPRKTKLFEAALKMALR